MSINTKEKISGVLLLNKLTGMSSNTALQKVKYLYNAQKAGHTGTLDPLATGLLPICFGEATKFASYLLEASKEYIASIKLGINTTTYDAEGEVVDERTVNVSFLQIAECLNSFVGVTTQTPPIYSALKVNGKALYEYARSGQEVAIKARTIEILSITLLAYDAQTQQLLIKVVCSKGTYIRSLAHDIGEKLHSGAYLFSLQRTKTNAFSLDPAITIDYLATLTKEGRQNLLLPVDVLVQHLPAYVLNDEQALKIKYGHQFLTQELAIEQKTTESNKQVRLYYQKVFLGIAIVDGQVIKPLRLITMA